MTQNLSTRKERWRPATALQLQVVGSQNCQKKTCEKCGFWAFHSIYHVCGGPVAMKPIQLLKQKSGHCLDFPTNFGVIHITVCPQPIVQLFFGHFQICREMHNFGAHAIGTPPMVPVHQALIGDIPMTPPASSIHLQWIHGRYCVWRVTARKAPTSSHVFSLFTDTTSHQQNGERQCGPHDCRSKG